MPLARRALLSFGILAVAPATARAVPEEAAFRAINRAAVEQVLLPAYRRFAEATANLAARLDALARAPQEAPALEAAREGFARAMLAWQEIQHVRVGPAELFSRHPRIQLWPDPDDAIGRDLAVAIAARDPAALEARPNALGQVTTQGLPALERLLHGAEAVARLRAGDAEAAYRGALLRAIGGNLSTLAQDMLAGWTGGEAPFGAALIAPSTPYATPQEATLELFRALHAAVAAVAGRKLAQALGGSAGTARAQRLEAWRSGLSGQAVRANLAAARALHEKAFAPALAAGEPELKGLLDSGFARAGTLAAAMPLPLEAAIGDPARREAVVAVQGQAAALAALLAGRLAPALGIPPGFNLPGTD